MAVVVFEDGEGGVVGCRANLMTAEPYKAGIGHANLLRRTGVYSYKCTVDGKIQTWHSTGA